MSFEIDTIPLELNLLREAMDDPELAIAAYKPAADYQLSHCLCPDGDAEMTDIVGAMEESLHAMLDHGFTDDDIRAVMGLVRKEDIDPDDTEGSEWMDYHTSIDLGWYLPPDLETFEVIAPEDCEKALRQEVTKSQIEQVSLALESDHLGIHDAMTLTEHEFTDWQAFAVCKAFREHVAPDALKAIADPRYNHAQMRSLAAVSLTASASVFQRCLNPDFTSEKMLLMGIAASLFIDRLGDSPSGDWHAIPYEELDESQLVATIHALDSNVPLDMLSRYADGTYPGGNMESIAVSFALGYEKPAIERLMNPAYSPEQAAYLTYVMGYSEHGGTGSLSDAQLDLLCDPDMSVATMEGAFYGIFHMHLDAEAVAPYVDGRFTKQQMWVIFDAAHNLDRSGQSPENVGDAMDFLSDPSLSSKQIQQLAMHLMDGKAIGELRDLKSQMLKHHHVPHAGHVSDRSLGSAAKASRDASSRLGQDARSDRTPSSHEKE